MSNFKSAALEVTLQRAHEFCQANSALALEALGSENRAHLGEGLIEVVVDDDVVVLRPVAHLIASTFHAVADDGVAVLGARPEPALEFGHRRREHEHADEIPAGTFAYLLGALPVEVEQHVATRRQGLVNRSTR